MRVGERRRQPKLIDQVSAPFVSLSAKTAGDSVSARDRFLAQNECLNFTAGVMVLVDQFWWLQIINRSTTVFQRMLVHKLFCNHLESNYMTRVFSWLVSSIASRLPTRFDTRSQGAAHPPSTTFHHWSHSFPCYQLFESPFMKWGYPSADYIVEFNSSSFRTLIRSDSDSF